MPKPKTAEHGQDQLDAAVKAACAGRSVMVGTNDIAKEILGGCTVRHAARFMSQPGAPAALQIVSGYLFVRADVVRFALTRPVVSVETRHARTANALRKRGVKPKAAVAPGNSRKTSLSPSAATA